MRSSWKAFHPSCTAPGGYSSSVPKQSTSYADSAHHKSARLQLQAPWLALSVHVNMLSQYAAANATRLDLAGRGADASDLVALLVVAARVRLDLRQRQLHLFPAQNAGVRATV